MTDRRDWQLQQLGIVRWTLRRPAALQGEVALTLPDTLRLVVVAATLPRLTDPLVADVLRALTLDAEQVMLLTPERAAMLPEGRRCNSWLMGVETDLVLSGARLLSPDPGELQRSAQARAALWRQICEYEQYFFS
ncbi:MULTISPECIES: DNA polymerase III subunit psi [Tenebrionibacter/Tenebrionicola group]|jgi:DNA polymerase-3 subunit psi|uniref:DNA polymerase III subunit psi n=2 Tax=Tenebrionibacter/Tenebrionicola group TaxID=2969848 RepID=A0A8K0V283_9ENTR|nr:MULTISPECIES: DNA polymerase III subunit psi [Tenebrionibacter/Tenebrionicola group]MBK4715658.1 DNA polymerase III subunit psi [Tenebrionibacter intestinalis]MBV4412402.1 DNA polymerase III subunit psi [Tenebrionicola larvae]MBV5096411.1 DNA polymerase III subunit psi [Tenebrionicola larvae]